MSVALSPTPVVSERQKSDPLLFHIPTFKVKIAGAGLPDDVLRDISELTYRDSLTELDQFELTVNNWDADKRRFKYIGSEEAADLTSSAPDKALYRLFEPCSKRVIVQMGYLGATVEMMQANFTTMESRFPNSGAPTLTVRGLNVFHKLRNKKYTTAWENKTPSQIARNIAALADGGKRRFPVPIKVVPGTENGEQQIPYLTQTSQFDIDFLLNFARQHGYELSLVGKDRDERLEFGRASEARLPVNYQLDWGRALVDFTPTLTTAGQFKSVTVRGWDRTRQKPIEEKVAHDDPELRKLNAKFGEMVTQCDPKEEQVVDLPVFSKADARRRALALMRDNSARMVRASGSTVGLPELRAGTRIRIGNLGARLSGDYLVTKTTHTIGDSGYTTRFECRMEDYQGKPR